MALLIAGARRRQRMNDRGFHARARGPQLRRGAALLALIVCGGCVYPPRQTVFTFSYALRSEQPASEPIAGNMLIDLSPGESQFVTVDEKGFRGHTVTMQRSVTTEHGAEFAIAEDDRRIEFLRRSDDGSIALTAVIDRKENALTLFDPPLTVAPALLRPGETFTSESAMRVVAFDNRQKQRERGTAKRTMTYINDAVLLLAAGEVRTAQIDIHFTADLRLADAEERTTLYIAREGDGDATGLIASDIREKVTILGAFPRESRRVLVRQ
jgi:hypothetical protein